MWCGLRPEVLVNKSDFGFERNKIFVKILNNFDRFATWDAVLYLHKKNSM